MRPSPPSIVALVRRIGLCFLARSAASLAIDPDLGSDAQAWPDRVDARRARFYVISAYNRPGMVNRFVNTQPTY